MVLTIVLIFFNLVLPTKFDLPHGKNLPVNINTRFINNSNVMILFIQMSQGMSQTHDTVMVMKTGTGIHTEHVTVLYCKFDQYCLGLYNTVQYLIFFILRVKIYYIFALIQRETEHTYND